MSKLVYTQVGLAEVGHLNRTNQAELLNNTNLAMEKMTKTSLPWWQVASPDHTRQLPGAYRPPAACCVLYTMYSVLLLCTKLLSSEPRRTKNPCSKIDSKFVKGCKRSTRFLLVADSCRHVSKKKSKQIRGLGMDIRS